MENFPEILNSSRHGRLFLYTGDRGPAFKIITAGSEERARKELAPIEGATPAPVKDREIEVSLNPKR